MGTRKDSRANAPWGKDAGNRRSRAERLGGLVVAAALALTILPAAALAGSGDKGKGDSGKAQRVRPNGPGKQGEGWIPPGLLDDARKNPDKQYEVIIQSTDGAEAAVQAVESGTGSGKANRRLRAIGAVAAKIDGKKLASLSSRTGISVTPDSPLKMFTASNDALWATASGASNLWSAPASSNAPTIAVVDSGIENRADFGSRLLASVDIIGGAKNSPGDGNGHGTFVAGLAAGGADGHAGVSPSARLVALDVLDDDGHGRASDVILACEWIMANKAAYGIKVANLSLGARSSGLADPLNKAIEKLWLSGVTVVASSGNYGDATGPSNVKYAPANDPFVITVGAADLNGTAGVTDDFIAPWSAWGQTSDGFRKPEISAPGRHLVSSVPAGSTLPSLVPARVTAPGYMWMSGTSFAAAIVSGTAAEILARNPGFGPDEVKGALMVEARQLASPAAGVGEIDAAASALRTSAPNPNAGLLAFVVPDSTGAPVFDDTAWFAVASTNPTWDAATWSQTSWNETSWNETSWNESTWNESTWNETSWLEGTLLE